MILNLYKKHACRRHPDIKVHVGCGQNYFDGWVNLDIDSSMADISHDMRKRLWFFDNSVSIIYSEHFIEHVEIEQAEKIFKEFYRVLKPRGIVRIATPDLDHLIAKYVSEDWRTQYWIRNLRSEIQTRAEMLNICFHDWGHKYLYNAEELERRLREVGFGRISRQPWHVSQHPELANRETREDSKLILEAVK